MLKSTLKSQTSSNRLSRIQHYPFLSQERLTMMAMSTPIMDHAPPSRGLLDQPNEVLHMIVGFLERIPFVKFVDEDGIKRKVSPYLVLAQVCMRLRRIVLAADFWQHPYFDFSDLTYHEADRGRRTDYAIALRGFRAGGLMKVLLEDEELLNNLKRKKAWLFIHIETVLMATMSGSWFLHSIESVGLQLLEGEMLPALRSLRSCHQIKQLKISMRGFNRKPGQMDLDLIPKCLPHLRHLEIDFSDFKGSLQGLENLTDLVVVCFSGPIHLNDASSSVLPLTSRSTLRSLTLSWVFDLPDDILNKFSNLTHFTCSSLQEDVVTTLSKLTNVKLHSLRLCVLSDEDTEHLANLWSSECLSKLKRLDLRFDCFVSWGSGHEMRAIFQHAIHSGILRLETLEHLQLAGGFDVAWCPHLASLKRLKCLQLIILKDVIGCTVGEEFYGVEAFPPLDGLKGCLENWAKADGLIAILKKEFEVPPKMKISYVDELDCQEFMEDSGCPCGVDGDN